jgi:uncharacterized membrane protein (DUF2068 family)
MAAATKKKKRKEETYPWKAGASSGHITKLMQSIFAPFDIYDLYKHWALFTYAFNIALIIFIGWGQRRLYRHFSVKGPML